ncbi:SDR family oxidoreductase [Pontibacter anaerobius]|uniref:SDR family oxidoreductase n=1 Tax=Pontibacter anaerobius TaxID=2993940 RepID=A0ABT3RH59_9BACT|nr:SDR family oxidoreductase [Pontibacter anaerobius]MCX2740781.1 SDR family oxidoreductase [Pontibacter anaerobius]
MAISLKPLRDQVIVITGASSGIGLATARAAARKGARLVLASRNQERLAIIEEQLMLEGAQATHVVADVGNREDVQRIADAAIEKFGGFDTWINNAGVSIYGKLADVSDEDSRRLFDTNFWGVVSGSLIAANYLRNQGGAIINLGSELSDVAIPLQGMYSASKHAVKGFTDALRMELEEDEAPVSVTLIKPAGINTPYPEHARNYTEYELTLPPPVYEPEEVANAILYAAEHPERDIYIGSGSKMMSSLNKYAPSLVDWVNKKFMTNLQVTDQPAHHKEGSLHQPGTDGNVHGNHKGHVMKTSLYTRASLHPVITGAVVAAAGAAAVALAGRKRSNSHRKVGKD